MIQAQILADSINLQGDRITTMKVTFPRIVLAEFNTHRMFSRNSASSRAIPFKKMVKNVINNPFIPIAIQKDHKGMQGKEYIDMDKEYTWEEISPLLYEFLTRNFKDKKGNWDEDYKLIDEVLNKYVIPLLISEDIITWRKWWLKTRDLVVAAAMISYAMGATKQIVNRLLEPFMWHTVIVTATEWENFFKLRCPQFQIGKKSFLSRKEAYDYYKIKKSHWAAYCMEIEDELEWLNHNKGQAEIHISLLAEKMYDALKESTPKQLQAGKWHIPFGDNMDEEELAKLHSGLVPLTQDVINQMKLKIAVARCARISYQTFGDNPKVDYAADIKLHDMLASNGHASPFEHVARVMSSNEYYNDYHVGSLIQPYEDNPKAKFGWCRNFKGFIQYRELLENER